MPALLFGSISTLADTSEIQRAAFNEAFRQHGLDWQWDRDDYRAMLDSNGGANRIADYAKSRGEDVDASAVHETKSSIFQQKLADSGAQARPGVADTIKAAKGANTRVGLVTTTSPANIAALLDALSPEITRDDFDLVVDATVVDDPKPDKAAYGYALDTLGEQGSACVAIEDNVGGVQAATSAGITCVAFPNENTAGHDFHEAEKTVDRLDFAELQALVAG